MDVEKIHKEINRRGFLAVARDGQLAWIAALGWSRKYFLVHIALMLVVTPVAFWLAYISPLGEGIDKGFLQEGVQPIALLALSIARAVYWVCLLLPPVAIIGFLVFTITGMFSRQFWMEIAEIREPDLEKREPS